MENVSPNCEIFPEFHLAFQSSSFLFFKMSAAPSVIQQTSESRSSSSNIIATMISSVFTLLTTTQWLPRTRPSKPSTVFHANVISSSNALRSRKRHCVVVPNQAFSAHILGGEVGRAYSQDGPTRKPRQLQTCATAHGKTTGNSKIAVTFSNNI